jgi:chorismate mutase / prephenate dehydratase
MKIDETLEDLRKKVDEINIDLLKSIKKRFEIGKLIAIVKEKNNIPVKDHERERIMLNNLKNRAKELNMCSDFTEGLFKLIINETIKIQKNYKNNKNHKENGIC